VFAGLGVPEVWVWNDGHQAIEVPSYRRAPRTRPVRW
jgi:hypothetical protein